MSKTSEKKKLNDENIKEYTTSDVEKLIQEYEVNKYGFPPMLPQKNKLGKTVFLSFYKAKIKSLDGNVIDEEEATFDILDNESFDKNDELALTKIKFLSALFSTNRFVDGGVYFRGQFYTRKMTVKFAKFLTRKFMENYFHIEDGSMLYDYFDKMDGGYLPYWPQKSYEKNHEAIFSAVNASVTKLGNASKSSIKLSFDIFDNDTFDLSNPDDCKKIEVIKSLLDSDMLVEGFYYKGELLPNHLSDKFKLYLEKTFIRRNFTVNQKEFLLLNFSKQKETNYPLFWPRKDKDGRNIKISVIDADVSLIGVDTKYANFDLYTDEPFDLNNEENRIKLNIIQGIYSNKSLLTGALYFDGMLIPGDLNKSDIEFRKSVVEKTYKIYIDDNEDFLRINKNFTIEDRFNLLNLTTIYDRYYPNNIDKIKQKDISYDKESNVLAKIDRINIVDELGKFVLENDFSLQINKDSKYEDIKSDVFDKVLEAIFTKDVKIRGVIYYCGHNIAQNKKSTEYQEFLNQLSQILPADLVSKLNENKNKEIYKYKVDKKTGMLKYWPTIDRNGKEVLLSVVKADMFFGSGKRTVKACNSLNFDIYVGETFGLVGESGSGKTTISRAILGIYNLTNGAIYFRGKLISGKQTKAELKQNKKNIQMIFQDPAASLNERANIDYIVSEGLYNFNLFKTKEERLDKVSRMMKSVGLLPEHLSRYPHEFSGGQRQRIGIARALVIEPQLVLADEPISALDVSIRAQVLNLLKKLQNEKDLTYLFIAHDLSIIRYISDRIAVMHSGHIVELGRAEDIYSNPIHPYTRALLTAIPQPDPKSKNTRKKLVYNKSDLDYNKCSWIMVKPGHYILATEELAEKWVKNDIDKKYLIDSNEVFAKQSEELKAKKIEEKDE